MNAETAGKTVRSLENACGATPERLRGVSTTRRYTNPRLPLPYLLPHDFRYIGSVIGALAKRGLYRQQVTSFVTKI